MNITLKRSILWATSLLICNVSWIATAQPKGTAKKDVYSLLFPPMKEGGKAVQGIVVYLYEQERMWRVGEPIIFKTAIRNEGDRNLKFLYNKRGVRAQVEVNGVWYDFEKSGNFFFRDGCVSGTSRNLARQIPFGPGQQYDDLNVIVADSWFSIPEGKAVDYAMRSYEGSGWINISDKPQRTELLFTPGQYCIRIAYTCPGANVMAGRPVRIVSNTIDVHTTHLRKGKPCGFQETAP